MQIIEESEDEIVDRRIVHGLSTVTIDIIYFLSLSVLSSLLLHANSYNVYNSFHCSILWNI